MKCFPAIYFVSCIPVNHGRTHPGSLGLSDDDYEDLLERLRVADFLYTEYSLEEVIYQLAKVMFSQSLTRGTPSFILLYEACISGSNLDGDMRVTEICRNRPNLLRECDKFIGVPKVKKKKSSFVLWNYENIILFC